MYAASQRGDNELKLVAMLIESGADVNARDNNGRTALSYTQYEPMIGALINAGGVR
jgi:ankyrin repeat protein